MKRLAIGTVLFLVSFSTPTPGSANLVFLTQEMGQSLGSVENIRGTSEVIRGNDAILTQAKVGVGLQDNVAPQQFLPSKASGQSLTQAQVEMSAERLRRWTLSHASGGPAHSGASELAIWLLMVAGFALSGIALRNRSDGQMESRHRQSRRLRAERV